MRMMLSSLLSRTSFLSLQYIKLIYRRESDENIFEGLEVDEDTKTELISYVKRRLAPQPVKIRGDIEVTCFQYEGIDAIKEALLEGESLSTADSQVVIRLIAPPMYVVTCMTLDKDAGIEQLNNAIEKIATSIRSKGYGGTLE